MIIASILVLTVLGQKVRKMWNSNEDLNQDRESKQDLNQDKESKHSIDSLQDNSITDLDKAQTFEDFLLVKF